MRVGVRLSTRTGRKQLQNLTNHEHGYNGLGVGYVKANTRCRIKIPLALSNTRFCHTFAFKRLFLSFDVS